MRPQGGQAVQSRVPICRHSSNSKPSWKGAWARQQAGNGAVSCARQMQNSQPGGPLQSMLQRASGLAAALLLATSLGTAPVMARDGVLTPLVPGRPATDYEAIARKRHGKAKSLLPSGREAEALLEWDRDMFTQQAWEGMRIIAQYSRYVDALKDAEEAPGCEQCTSNRLLLERSWQVVANEFFSPAGDFDQAMWANQLLSTLKAAGCLHTKHQTYAAAHAMVASLGDRFTEFLQPTAYRRAIRRPQPAEREYLAAQFTGVGLQVGSKTSDAGGWPVDAVMAESPAEQGGVLQGDRIIEIDGYPAGELTRHEVDELLRGPSGSLVILTVAPAAGPEARLTNSAAAGRSLSGGDLLPVPVAALPPLVAAAPGLMAKAQELQQGLAAAAARQQLQQQRVVYLERRPLPQPPLKQALIGLPDGPSIGYIRLHYFCSEGTRAFADAVRFDEFYDVAGGVFEEAIATASMLLDDKQEIAETVRTGALVDNVWRVGSLSKTVFPKSPGKLTDKPFVLLTNSSSASASEVLTGALHDNHRAAVVGQKTFGKGVVQYYFPNKDGSGLKVTVAKYLTPSGYDISREGGIAPDQVCHDYPHESVTPVQDACIRAALQLLEQQQT